MLLLRRTHFTAGSHRPFDGRVSPYLTTNLCKGTSSATQRTRRRHIFRSTNPKDEGASSRHPEFDDEGSQDSILLPLSGADTDWREFRARLVASARAASSPPSDTEPAASAGSTSSSPAQWAHSIPGPEKGCLLLAHPQMFSNSQEYFYQAAILMLEHNERGSYGIILNRPSMYTLSNLSMTVELPEFQDCRLYVGGDVGGGEVHMLHTHGELEGAVEVVKGIYVGGMAAAQKAVASGRLKAEDFRWFAKYSGWGPGQLEQECRMGVWFTAAASPAVMLAPPASEDGCDTWHNVLTLMGGDYRELSMNLRAAEQRHKQAVQREREGLTEHEHE